MKLLTYIQKPKESKEVKAIKWDSVDQIDDLCQLLNGKHSTSNGKNFIEYSPFNNEATRTAEMPCYFRETESVLFEIPAEEFEQEFVPKYMTPTEGN